MDSGSLKRPIEEMNMEMDMPSKKPRGDFPSKVIFMRGLPRGTTDSEINEVCSPFGILANILKLDAKCQAFVEFEVIDSARMFIDTYAGGCPIRDQVWVCVWRAIDVGVFSGESLDVLHL